MNSAATNALIDTGWLHEHLADADLRIVESTWYLPNVDREGIADYRNAHIPGAVFWDIDAICDPDSELPHMLPDQAVFANHAGRLGISNDSHVVVYDNSGMQTSPRVWWMLRAFGHRRVSVLDGGMRKWLAEDRPVSAETPTITPVHYKAKLTASMVRSMEDIRSNIESRKEQVLDARSAGRFAGTEPEPRPQCRPGHIPGSLNLPSATLVDPDTGTFRGAAELEATFAESGLDLQAPVITSCGSGITACVLAFGLHLLGKSDFAVYDGSWTEWGSGDMPVET